MLKIENEKIFPHENPLKSFIPTLLDLSCFCIKVICAEATFFNASQSVEISLHDAYSQQKNNACFSIIDMLFK